jgi:hypothetical protein
VSYLYILASNQKSTRSYEGTVVCRCGILSSMRCMSTKVNMEMEYFDEVNVERLNVDEVYVDKSYVDEVMWRSTMR